MDYYHNSCVFDRKAFVTQGNLPGRISSLTESINALEDCRELSNRGHAYKLSKTAEVTGTVLWHVAHRTLPPPIKMSDTEAKLDEQNVDNGMQEAEAKKEDVNVDVENADNEIEVEKKQDESDATPIVNKSGYRLAYQGWWIADCEEASKTARRRR